jgi:hypothetical protein
MQIWLGAEATGARRRRTATTIKGSQRVAVNKRRQPSQREV